MSQSPQKIGVFSDGEKKKAMTPPQETVAIPSKNRGVFWQASAIDIQVQSSCIVAIPSKNRGVFWQRGRNLLSFWAGWCVAIPSKNRGVFWQASAIDIQVQSSCIVAIPSKNRGVFWQCSGCLLIKRKSTSRNPLKKSGCFLTSSSTYRVREYGKRQVAIPSKNRGVFWHKLMKNII